MHKHELAKSKTTENRAINAIINEQILEWAKKVKEAGRIDNGGGVSSSIDKVADVIVDLILQTEQGKYPREVVSGLVKRIDLKASLVIAQRKLARRG